MRLTSALVLEYPDYETLFVICADASSRADGAILSQADENDRDHLVYCAIQALSSAESNYSAFEREALGVVLH